MRRRNGLKHITNLATNRAKKYCLIIGWGLLLFNTSHAQQDTLLIKSFNPGDYKASALTYTGSMGADGFYYFANENGILKYDGSRWELITINNFSAVYSMSIDSTGRIYVGGFGEIGYVEKVKNRYKYTSLTNLIGEDRVNDEFWQTELFKGDVYFASYESIYRYDGTEIFKINHKNSHIFVVDNQLITSVFGGGTYQIKSDSVILINEQKNPSNDAAFAILPTNVPTQFWALTSVSELTKFNSNDYTMHKLEIPAADNLKRAAIYDGVLWNDSLYVLSSWNEGLLFLNKKGELVKTIKQENGLPTNSLRELFIDERMNIWVTSEYGIIYLNWRKKTSQFSPKTVITNTSFKHSTDSSIISVEFQYATTGYDKSDLQYSYFLDGFDEDYSSWNNEVKKEYTNLDGGNYTFHVKGLLPDGTETEVAKSEIIIPTPWYLRNWVIGLMIIVFVSLIVSAIRIRTLRLKKLNKRLEKVITDRTKELIEQREHLKKANKELKIANVELDNFVYRSSHDLIAPLKSLKGLIYVTRLEAGGETRFSENFDKMNKSILKLEEFIKSIMEYSTNAKSKLVYESVLLDVIIEGIVNDLKFYNNAEKVRLVRSYPQNMEIKSDGKRLNIILSNLITNSIKYHNYDQPDPYIEVKASKNGTSINIEVIDNGLGIDQKHQKSIFDMFYRASERGEGSGLGLYIVKDTIGVLNGEIIVNSKPYVGTTFHISLPTK